MLLLDTSEFQSKLDKVHSCLDQKVVLLTKMLNLTKQIEVQTRNEDIFLDDLLADRGNCIERYNKCSLLIKQLSEQIKLDDEDYFNILNKALLGEKVEDIKLSVITELSVKANDLYEKIKVINASAQENLLKQRDKLKEEGKAFRSSEYNKSNLFRN